MKKTVIIGVLVIVAAAIAVGTWYLASNLDSLVAAAIEKQGSKVTQTSVNVSGVDLSLREGRGSIKGLRVASPEGYKAGNAISLGEITLKLDLGSVREDPVVIDEVRIEAPVVHVEITGKGSSNIDELRKRIQAYSPGGEGESGGAGKRIRIKEFVFEKGRIEVDASALGMKERTLDLPEVRLSDVGGAQGAPPDEIAKIILGTEAKRVTSEIARSEVSRLIQDKLGGAISEKAKGLLDKIGD
jgi:hypothetical protein